MANISKSRQLTPKLREEKYVFLVLGWTVNLPLLPWRFVTTTSNILLFDHTQIIMPSSGVLICNMAASCLLFHRCQRASEDSSLHSEGGDEPCNTGSMLTEWQAGRQAGRQAGTHFLLLLPSSGHTFFVTLRFSLQEIVTKDEDKKTITCPEQLISVSCICMSAKILPYTETARGGPSKPVQGLRALSSHWA